MEIMGLACCHLLYVPLKPSFQSAEDVIESFKIPPLLLKSTDYQAVSVMVRLNTWKIVCACETSYQEFYATIRLLQNRYEKGTGPVLFDSYSKLLASLEKGGGTLLSEHYLNELQMFRRNQALEHANEDDVVMQWIYNSQKLRNKLRSWDSKFVIHVQDMLAVCPMSSGYRGVVDKLAEVNNRYDFKSVYEKMTSEESLKAVFILYALKSLETGCSVDNVTKFREGFMANCKKHVMRMNDRLGLHFLASARSLAGMAMLTFLRVGRGWEEKWERSIVVKVYPYDGEVKARQFMGGKVFESVDDNAEKNEDLNVDKKTYVLDKSAEEDEMKEDSDEGELSESPAVFDHV